MFEGFVDMMNLEGTWVQYEDGTIKVYKDGEWHVIQRSPYLPMGETKEGEKCKKMDPRNLI